METSLKKRNNVLHIKILSITCLYFKRVYLLLILVGLVRLVDLEGNTISEQTGPTTGFKLVFEKIVFLDGR